MDIATIGSLISNLGFPIVCVLGLAWFAYYMVKSNREENKTYYDKMQKRCQEREDKLYSEIAECRKINEKAIETIASYAEKLDTIQKDIGDIKTDITIIKSKS